MTTDDGQARSAGRAARLAQIDLPDFGMPSEEPRIPAGHDVARMEPFSNIPAFLPPFLLRPDRAMTVTR